MGYQVIADNSTIDRQLLDFESSLEDKAEVIGYQVYQTDQKDQALNNPELEGRVGTDHDVVVYFAENDGDQLGVGAFIQFRDGNGKTQQLGPLSFTEALNEAAKAQGV